MKAMYIGSFDPFTLGHLDVVKKVLALTITEPGTSREIERNYPKYEKLIICVGCNDAKTPLFSAEKRKKFIELTIADLPRADDITVITNGGLTVNIANENGINTLIRGIRSDSTDLYSEKQMAEANRLLAAARGFKLETDFIIQDDPFLQNVSSSLVHSLLQMQEYIAMARCLPKCITEEIVAQKLQLNFMGIFRNHVVAGYYWEKVKKAYSGRPYHNLIHLAYMFNQLHIYKQYCSQENSLINVNLYLAIFLHDYAYTARQEIQPQQNEQNSANISTLWGQQMIFNPNINISTVTQLIMATTHTQKSLTEQQKLIADLDLSILGTADYGTYNAYAEAIREEYKTYSDKEYKKGRLTFLFDLLKKKHLFHTTFFRERFEEQARKNITAEIKHLHGKS